MSDIHYRLAEIQDSALILDYIKKLAIYEKLEHEVVATQFDIERSLFCEDAKAFCVISEFQGKPCGFALCFYNYSTFQGKAGIYIEDLYVEPELLGKGIGKGFFGFLVEKAKIENCGRIQWWVLDWNEPSINFYKAMGAKAMDEWTVFRLDEEAIAQFSDNEGVINA